jgi:hypothetical protein
MAGAAFRGNSKEFHDAHTLLAEAGFSTDLLQDIIKPLPEQSTPGFPELNASQRTLLSSPLPKSPLTKTELIAAFTSPTGAFLLTADSWNENHKKALTDLVDYRLPPSSPYAQDALNLQFHAHAKRKGTMSFVDQT